MRVWEVLAAGLLFYLLRDQFKPMGIDQLPTYFGYSDMTSLATSLIGNFMINEEQLQIRLAEAVQILTGLLGEVQMVCISFRWINPTARL